MENPMRKLKNCVSRAYPEGTNIAAEFAPPEQSSLASMETDQPRDQTPWPRPEEGLSMDREAWPGFKIIGNTQRWR
jgi:hypothetical protein